MTLDYLPYLPPPTPMAQEGHWRRRSFSPDEAKPPYPLSREAGRDSSPQDCDVALIRID